MKLKEVAKKLEEAVVAVANLGVEKPRLKSIFEPVPDEIHRLVMLEGFDRRDIVEDPKTQLIYIANNEPNLLRLQNKFAARHSRGGTGISSPMVVITQLDGFVEAIDLPLAEAELAIATDPDLSDTLPSEFGVKPLKGKPQKYKDLSSEVREAVVRYALGQRPSLHIEERSSNSKTFAGRVKNIEEDVANLVGEKISATGQKLGVSAKNTLRQVPVVGLNLAKTTISAIKETPRVVRDTVQLGVFGFAIGEAVTESLVEPVLNRALSDAKDTAITFGDKLASLPKTPTDVISAVIINQLKKS